MSYSRQPGGKLVKLAREKAKFHHTEVTSYPGEMPLRARKLAEKMYQAMIPVADRIDSTSRIDRAWAACFVAFSEIALLPDDMREDFFEHVKRAHDEFVPIIREKNFGATSEIGSPEVCDGTLLAVSATQ
jgi:hypothetical protein